MGMESNLFTAAFKSRGYLANNVKSCCPALICQIRPLHKNHSDKKLSRDDALSVNDQQTIRCETCINDDLCLSQVNIGESSIIRSRRANCSVNISTVIRKINARENVAQSVSEDYDCWQLQAKSKFSSYHNTQSLLQTS